MLLTLNAVLSGIWLSASAAPSVLTLSGAPSQGFLTVFSPLTLRPICWQTTLRVSSRQPLTKLLQLLLKVLLAALLQIRPRLNEVPSLLRQLPRWKLPRLKPPSPKSHRPEPPRLHSLRLKSPAFPIETVHEDPVGLGVAPAVPVVVPVAPLA